MLTTIVLGTTGYSSDGTAYPGFAGAGGTVSWADARIFGLRWTASDEAYSTLEFTVIGCGPAAPFPAGLPVQLVITGEMSGAPGPGYFAPSYFGPSYFAPDYFGTPGLDLSGPVVRFTGDLQRGQETQSLQGPAWSYLCTDLKKRAESATLLGTNGLAVASYNLQTTDPLYLFNLAGKTVGEICIDILQGVANATTLDGLGVGNYVTLSPPTLPAATLADLALLAVVPPTPVQLQGQGPLNVLQQFIQTWQAQYTTYVEPDGTIRVTSIFGRPAYTLTQPSYLTEGDPVYDLNATVPDLSDCYTAVQIVGQDISGSVLSFRDGTLAPGWTMPQQAAWTIASFTSPASNAAAVSNDDGTLPTLSPTTCTVHSAHPTVHWTLNYLSDNGGVIVFYWLAGTGIAITETRQITSNTAMSPGGSATVTWDASQPLGTSSYDHYRIFLTNTAESLVDRKFLVREPATGLTGLDTWIGSHMYPIFPFGFAWGNIARGGQDQVIQYPTAQVLWSQTGQWPWFSEPVNVDLNPTDGSIVLRLPAVFISAALAGQTAALTQGYPTTFFGGLWYDVQIAVPYNRGALNVRVPSSGFSGTAFTKYGKDRVKTLALSDFIYAGSTPALATLAADHLLTIQDAVIEGSIGMHYDAWTPTFDPFTLGYALNIVTPGGASDIDGVNLPVRSFTVEWPDTGPDIHRLTFNFNNRHRPFEGDALYLPHTFSANGWGTQQGSTFVGGMMNDWVGTVDSKTLYGGLVQSGDGHNPNFTAGDKGMVDQMVLDQLHGNTQGNAGGSGGGDPGSSGGGGLGGLGSPMAGMQQGSGLKRTENDTRREKRLERDQSPARQRDRAEIDHAKMAENERAKNKEDYGNRSVPEPDVAPAEVAPEKRVSLRDQRNDTNEDGG